MTPRAAAAVSLTGPYAIPGRDAAAGLRAWADDRGVALDLHDDRGDRARVAEFCRTLAPRADILFGPYGSGLTRAAVDALPPTAPVLWNHGGAAVPRGPGARVVDVLGPAERYWAGIGPTLSRLGVNPAGVLIVHGESPFGRAVADGAEGSLRRLGHAPLARVSMRRGAAAVVQEARRRRASAVVGGGKIEDDLDLGRALAGGPWAVALVVCGVSLAKERLGDAVTGWIGPAQWAPETPLPEFAVGAVTDYPGAQAVAAALLAERARERAVSTSSSDVWDAARAMRERTFLGPFEVDTAGRQVAHAPLLVRWERDGRRVVWSPGEDAG